MTENSWIANDMIFITGGKGFGIHPTGNNICLGSEQFVQDIMSNHRVPGGTPKVIREVMEIVLKIDREVRIGKQRTITTNLRAPGFKQRNNQRIRLGAATRHDTKHFKPSKVRAKPSLHSDRQK